MSVSLLVPHPLGDLLQLNLTGMAGQKLFLWEFLITKIKFDPGAIAVPTFESIRIQLRCSNFLWSEINTDECFIESVAPDFKPKDGDFNIKFGKTSLFSFRPSDLADELTTNPLIIDLILSKKWAGSITLRWPPEFIDFASGPAVASLNSVTHTSTLDFSDFSKKKIAAVTLSIKLVCVGDNVETYFRYRGTETEFKNPMTNTQFTCEKLRQLEHVPSTMPAYNESKISWMGLYEGKMAADAVSVAPNFQDDNFRQMQAKPKAPDTVSHISGYWDIVSIKFRPAENKFMDLLHLMADEVLQASQHSLRQPKGKKPTFSDNIGVYGEPSPYDEEESTELTSEKIMKKVCDNPSCPAAQKFKEYGLGPLATGPGLGTMYKKVEPTRTYRRSNTYGVFARYGPFGILAKSEYPCFPPKEDDTEVCPLDFPCMPTEEEEEVCSCTEKTEKPAYECCEKVSRLRGGEESNVHPKEEKVKKHKKKKCSCPKYEHQNDKDIPLRLKGGGLVKIEDRLTTFRKTYESTMYEFDQIKYNFSKSINYGNVQPYSRLRGGGICDDEKPPLKSAMEECKSVMDQFDEILIAYRKALGPCGEASCPFSQNLVEKNCKRICVPPPREPCPCVPVDSCQEMPCTMEGCPYRDKTKKNFPAGCGSTKCPYAQYKMGLMDADAEMELAFLPPPIQGKCGDPKCDYPPQNIQLPPIHWDCPDPLPQGNCKNPNCPHQPNDLKEIKVPVPKTPCGSNACPYALPPPCDLPSCPFRQKPCPFQSQKKAGEKKPSCNIESSSESDEGSICCNPDCPYKNKNAKPDKSGCNNPKCPYGQKPKKKQKKPTCSCRKDSNSEESFCDSPECPLNRRKPEGDACDNPECPSKVIKRHSKKDDGQLCDNPDCPYRNGMGNRDDDEVCDNPSCPFREKGGKNVDCSNPNCIYKGSSGVKDYDDNASICSSPDCPFAKRRKAQTRDDNVCCNPNCPYKNKKDDGDEDDNECNACNKGICSNPDCPHKQSTGPDYCDNPMCPFSKEYQTSICCDPFCPYAQPLPSCGIPNCPYEKKPILYCPSPICPSKFPPERPAAVTQPQQTQRRVSAEKEKEKKPASDGESRRGSATDKNTPKTPYESKPTTTATETQMQKKKSPYVYSFGDQWPGVKIGHRECLPPRFRIPPKMGWMWKIQQPYFGCKMRRGWRPGCIQKLVAAMIRTHREAKGLGLLMMPDFGKGGKARRGAGTESSDSVHVRPKPTLHITKKDGAYMITMNPLKDPNTLAENEDPYIDCTPMQFKIIKNKLKTGDDDLCHCNDQPEEDSDDSELDIEFTPPAGIIHPERFKKKKNVIHCESQYNPADFAEKKKGAAKKSDKKGDKKSRKGGKEKGKKKVIKKNTSYC